MTAALERLLAEKLVHHVLGDGGGHFEQMYARMRINMRFKRRRWRYGTAAALK